MKYLLILLAFAGCMNAMEQKTGRDIDEVIAQTDASRTSGESTQPRPSLYGETPRDATNLRRPTSKLGRPSLLARCIKFCCCLD